MTFNGVYAQWLTKKSPVYGQAKITLDGKDMGIVDLYSSSTLWVQKVWDTGLLANGAHTVKIEWTGVKNASATGTNIGLDAFDVIGTPAQATSGPTALRYQDTDRNITYTGLWESTTSTSASGETFRYIDKAGGKASVTFNGTYLAWIAKKSNQYGIARVTVDGEDKGTVDLYSASATFGASVWNTGTLDSGEHTVTIEWTGDKNASSTASNIGLDAFDIIGTVVAPAGLTRVDQTDTQHRLRRHLVDVLHDERVGWQLQAGQHQRRLGHDDVHGHVPVLGRHRGHHHRQGLRVARRRGGAERRPGARRRAVPEERVGHRRPQSRARTRSHPVGHRQRRRQVHHRRRLRRDRDSGHRHPAAGPDADSHPLRAARQPLRVRGDVDREFQHLRLQRQLPLRRHAGFVGHGHLRRHLPGLDRQDAARSTASPR